MSAYAKKQTTFIVSSNIIPQAPDCSALQLSLAYEGRVPSNRGTEGGPGFPGFLYRGFKFTKGARFVNFT